MGAKTGLKSFPSLSNMLTRNALMLLFFVVFFFSVLVGPPVTGSSLFFSVVKGLMAVALSWVFLLVISDALVRSIRASALDAKASRRDGGLLYHFLPPDPDELLDGEADAETSSLVDPKK